MGVCREPMHFQKYISLIVFLGISGFFRIISSSINSPLYTLASFFQKKIFKNIPTPKSRINNSFYLKCSLEDLCIAEDFQCMSLDAISSLHLAIKSVFKQWELISSNCPVLTDE